MDQLTPTELLAALTGMGGLLLSGLTLLLRGREAAWTQAAGLRGEVRAELGELRGQVAAREAELEAARARLTGLEDEVSALHLDRRLLLDYLRDVAGGHFGPGWCGRRARDLLRRLEQEREGGSVC
ncbi:hypothetical protein F8S09_08205 [Deinococcus sp. SDU3-2]|uniref:Uncharacterized protein n=1 Tax=Deinococcus terrestris TaxID=2651870 RepID=A0A7X1NVN7_9DEIO|nr:hypothetical protein [Deinococcus terrestris]MPY66675.1 hypothetical protein [Deinococcus terrestris]